MAALRSLPAMRADPSPVMQIWSARKHDLCIWCMYPLEVCDCREDIRDTRGSSEPEVEPNE